MKLYLELIWSVSLTGTLPFCLYLLLRKKLESRITATLQYHLLKLFLLCFIIPFALIKSLIISSATTHAPVMNEYYYFENRIVQTSEGYYLFPKGGFYQILIPIWSSILACLVLLQLYRYLRFRHKILCRLKPDYTHQTELTVCKAQMGVRQPVSLLYCDAEISPFTCGIFHPCIVLTPIVTENTASAAIQHELQHIKSHDFFFRSIAFFVVLLHCWNPFVYLLWKELCEIQEMACDEKITDALTPEEVRLYGYSVVSMTESVRQQPSFVTQFARNNKNIFRRITRLSTRCSKKSVAVSILLCISCLIGFCIPIAACSPEILYFGIDFGEDMYDTSWVYLEPKDYEAPACPEDEYHFQYTDQYFILENGEIIDYPSSTFSEDAAQSCIHSWRTSTMKRHQYDGSGGCAVLIYDVKVCTKCFLQKDEKLIETHNYIECPHGVK